jgi:hypothetical protein
MVAATLATLAYKLLLFLNSQFEWSVFSERAYEFMEKFDPSVFGVLVSCFVLSIMSPILLFNNSKRVNAK